jgi:hypothetical protein
MMPNVPTKQQKNESYASSHSHGTRARSKTILLDRRSTLALREDLLQAARNISKSESESTAIQLPQYQEQIEFFHSEQAIPQPTLQVIPQNTIQIKETLKETTPVTSPVVGFLVSFDNDPNGEIIPVRRGRSIITSRVLEPSPGINLILINDSSISPGHAILRTTGKDSLQIIDQLSDLGTAVIRDFNGTEEDISQAASELFHGEILRIGKRIFSICLLCMPRGIREECKLK